MLSVCITHRVVKTGVQAGRPLPIQAGRTCPENEAEQPYTVVDIATVRDKRLVSIVLIARLLDNHIVIELDYNNKELVDALKARDVPEDQIILAYRGEPVSK